MSAQPVQNTKCNLLSFPIEAFWYAEAGQGMAPQGMALRYEPGSRGGHVITHLRDRVDDDHLFPGLQESTHGSPERCFESLTRLDGEAVELNAIPVLQLR
jgi:hypothetical protein